MRLTDAIDDRTTAEQLRDLGVEVVKENKNTITGVRWADPEKGYNVKPRVSITDSSVYFSTAAVEMIKPEGKKYRFGAGRLGGVKVLLLQKVGEDEKGYAIRVTGRGDRRPHGTASARGLRRQLHKAGIKGRYELAMAEGHSDVWIGTPERKG